MTEMEKEHHNNQLSRYRLLESIDDLSLVRAFIDASNWVVIYGELEIEPFVEFSLPFQAQYWYLKYMLLKVGQVDLDSDEQKALYNEQGLNVIWLSIRNQCNTIIECRDGIWFVSIFDEDDIINTLLKSYKLSSV